MKELIERLRGWDDASRMNSSALEKEAASALEAADKQIAEFEAKTCPEAYLQQEITRLQSELAAVTAERDALKKADEWQPIETARQSVRISELTEQVKAARSIVSDCLTDLENGFVRCERCGDQEDTATLDVVPLLRDCLAKLQGAE